MNIDFRKLLLCSFIFVMAVTEAQENNSNTDLDLFGYARVYNEKCSACHGKNLLGTGQGTPLLGNALKHGDSLTSIEASIAQGFPGKMPRWSDSSSPVEIKNLALYIAEKRAGFSYNDFKMKSQFRMPQKKFDSQEHRFHLELVAENLDPLPFSIAPLPDGRILLVEKLKGLSIIAKNGVQSALIQNTPRIYGKTVEMISNSGLRSGNGWMFDVAIHPEYEKNGWIYLQYGDRCEYCNTFSRQNKRAVSMNKLVRGRIKQGMWVDEELIWQVDKKYYGVESDTSAGGRIAFDGKGYVYISVGMKGNDNHKGIQDLTTPWGKIHRVHDDGRIPKDNPFVMQAGAMKSIWTYGHRVPQGLEYNRRSGDLWESEMGPRGGDEINLLQAGENYGWPLQSRGLNYDGTKVEYGKVLNIKFDPKDLQQPVVDFTPAPAISSFIFYSGSVFPKWQDNIIVGSLKGTKLYRLTIKNNELVNTEILFAGLARIRDIEMEAGGTVLVLLEHADGARIIRIRP